MCIKCEAGVDEEYLVAVREMVAGSGWVIADLAGEVCDDGVFPAIAYTIGLTGLGHPEIVITGRMPDQAVEVLNLLASRVWDGLAIGAGDRWTAGGLDLEVIGVPGRPDWLRWAALIHPDRPVRGIQAVWADGEGLFPWQQEFPDDVTQTIFAPVPGSGTAA